MPELSEWQIQQQKAIKQQIAIKLRALDQTIPRFRQAIQELQGSIYAITGYYNNQYNKLTELDKLEIDLAIHGLTVELDRIVTATTKAVKKQIGD